MENITIPVTDCNEQLFAIMKKATAEAEANGLTQEILEQLLNEED